MVAFLLRFRALFTDVTESFITHFPENYLCIKYVPGIFRFDYTSTHWEGSTGIAANIPALKLVYTYIGVF